MNGKHFFKSLFIIFILVFGFSQPVYGQTGTTVKITPAFQAVDPGEIFSIDVIVENVTNLWAFDITIEYDAAIIVFDHSEFGDFLDSGMAAPVTSEPGRISCGMTQVSPAEAKSGSGVLCTLTFIAKEVDGELDLTLFSVELVEDETFALIPTTDLDGLVQVGEPKAGYETFIPLFLYSGVK